MSFNVFRLILGSWVIPGGILVLFPIHLNGVVTGDTLPRTGGVGAAFLEILLVDGVSGEVLVAFHDFALVALGENRTIPDCFWHCYLT